MSKKFMSKIVRDNNDINEKALIGIISFCIMIMFALVDLITGYFGKDLVIKEYIYTSFLILTLGSFGISSIDKYTNVKHGTTDYEEYDDYEDERYYN